ncbi:MAG: DUF1080 domain-containing protein [Kiritimatiellae bacterium]|nr:DUF1080 domain-containing protein [Kiritimatiellia bacterium]
MSETRELFNGKDLTGWKATGNPGAWGVEDGMIKCTPAKGGNLCTEAQYGDFELTLEYKTEPKVNSGVFFRISDLKDCVHTGLEIQILDTHGKTELGAHDSGALYDMLAPKVNAVKPAGEWNTMRIMANGPKMEIDLNGRRVVEASIDDWNTPGKNPDGTPNKFVKHAWKDLPKRGHIGLQDHNGVIWFRNIRLRELR